VKCGFESVHTAFWFEADRYKFILVHDPSVYTMFQNEKDTVVLVGHIHNLFKHMLPEKKIINVGVDVWNYKPVALEEILELLKEADATK
jgi:calcineurin-like phosphoesterase family protein